MPIYLQLDGIPGEATQADHKNWMVIQSMNWDVSRNMKTPAGSAMNREASEPRISEFTLNKVSDSSSVKLFQEACSGNRGKTAVIHLVSTGDPGETYIEYTLENALIADYQIESYGRRPVESISLNFTKMQLKYIPRGNSNEPGSPQISSYDLATTKAG